MNCFWWLVIILALLLATFAFLSIVIGRLPRIPSLQEGALGKMLALLLVLFRLDSVSCLGRWNYSRNRTVCGLCFCFPKEENMRKRDQHLLLSPSNVLWKALLLVKSISFSLALPSCCSPSNRIECVLTRRKRKRRQKTTQKMSLFVLS